MGCEVDPAFIQAIEHRPKPTVAEGGGIPLIDLSRLLDSPIPDNVSDSVPEALSALIAEVEGSCRDWGLFLVTNHGVPPELLSRIHKAAKEFFAQPAEVKRRIKRDEKNYLGYYDSEHTKNVRDWKEVFDFLAKEPPVSAGSGEQLTLKNQWPEYPPDLREACEEYASGVEKLAYKLIELIALTLGLPAKRLNGFFRDRNNFIRLNHYPPCPSPDLALGVGRHTDSGGLTILFQDDVGGLEVKRKSDGEWIRVKPIPDSYIIIVGNIIQVWSNDRYESAEHRVVVNSERGRFSTRYVFNPSDSTMVGPLAEVVAGEAARYEEYNWGEFSRARKASNFEKLEAENIQISHLQRASA